MPSDYDVAKDDYPQPTERDYLHDILEVLKDIRNLMQTLRNGDWEW